MSAALVEQFDDEDGEASLRLLRPDTRWWSRPRGGAWVVEAASAAALTGHGGSHFPAVRKWQAAMGQSKPVTVVVNAAESEHLSAKDAVLLRLRPHLVLDGAALLAESVGAARTVVWMHESAGTTRRAVERACRDRLADGRDESPATVMTGPAGYLSGESTAIKSAVHGGPAVPQFRRHGRSSQGSEILVHNVETLARLAALARIAATTPSCAAPALPTRSYRLLTVLTPTQERRVVEVDSSASLAEAVQVAVGERPAPDAAVLVGGYGGTWARWSDISCLPVSQDSMRRAGHSLGPGIIAPMWEPGCELAATKAVVDYLARSSAGQCGPCLFGLPAMAESLTRLAEGWPRRHEVAALRRDIGAVEGRGACHHPDGAVSLVRSALRLFGDDIELHASGRTCGRPGENLIPVPGSDRSE